MEYKAKLVLPAKLLSLINSFLKAKRENEFQGEDNTINYTVKFPNGFEMDIKCCGCQDEASWTEAVLFQSGKGNGLTECCFTEPGEEYAGEWALSDNDGNTYTVEVTEGDDLVPKPYLIPLNPAAPTGWSLA